MQTDIIPLGTASAIPSKDRHLSATALEREGRVLLFDCGEGTQMRLLAAGLKHMRIEAVFITHLHGDHFFGLMGLLSTLALLGREAPMTVVGPEGIGGLVCGMPGLKQAHLPYALTFVELAEDFTHAVVFEDDDVTVEARPLAHRVFTAGYRYAEKPRPGSLDVEQARALGVTDYRHYRALKAGEAVTLADGRTVAPEAVVGPPKPGGTFAYVFDTRPCVGGRLLARDVDLLYHEATFTDDLQERALDTGHATATEAAEVARDAGARRLLVGHFSARYTDPARIVTEAQRTFQNTEAAEELRRYPLRA